MRRAMEALLMSMALNHMIHIIRELCFFVKCVLKVSVDKHVSALCQSQSWSEEKKTEQNTVEKVLRTISKLKI